MWIIFSDALNTNVAVNIPWPVANFQLGIIPEVAWTVEDMSNTTEANVEFCAIISLEFSYHKFRFAGFQSFSILKAYWCISTVHKVPWPLGT